MHKRILLKKFLRHGQYAKMSASFFPLFWYIDSDIDPQILADPSEVIFDPSMIPQMPKTT